MRKPSVIEIRIMNIIAFFVIGFMICGITYSVIVSKKINNEGEIVIGKVVSLKKVKGGSYNIKVTYEFNQQNYTGMKGINSSQLPADYDSKHSKFFYKDRIIEIKVHKDYPDEFLVHKWR
jgi:hypothetical protein